MWLRVSIILTRQRYLCILCLPDPYLGVDSGITAMGWRDTYNHIASATNTSITSTIFDESSFKLDNIGRPPWSIDPKSGIS